MVLRMELYSIYVRFNTKALVATTIIIKYKVINMNSNEINSCDRKLRVEI